jgi:hypothetical protein
MEVDDYAIDGHTTSNVSVTSPQVSLDAHRTGAVLRCGENITLFSSPPNLLHLS